MKVRITGQGGQPGTPEGKGADGWVALELLPDDNGQVFVAEAEVPTDPEFQPGEYVHYKGGRYTAICLVFHHETREPMVLYRSHTNGKLNVRPLRGWDRYGENKPSCTHDCVDVDGWLDILVIESERVPRFKRVEP
jgi:hypothetical protein